MTEQNQPQRQYLAAYEVLPAMRREADFFIGLTPLQILVLSITGGCFVTLGGLFSVLLAMGVDTPGVQLLLQGLGFSTGFFMIILARAALFTEANVVLPATLLQGNAGALLGKAARFWAIAWFGNMLGCYLLGQVIAFAQHYPETFQSTLSYMVSKKMSYMEEGTTSAWLQIVVSGMLGNGLIGMAAFFATMANTLVSKFIPVFLVVSLFVAGNLQHSPANMGYFSLIMAMGEGPGWRDAFLWNILPAGLGNILGGTLLVALPFWFAFRNHLPPPER